VFSVAVCVAGIGMGGCFNETRVGKDLNATAVAHLKTLKDRPGGKQARKHVRDARGLNNIETRAVIKFFLQGKAPNEIHVILTET